MHKLRAYVLEQLEEYPSNRRKVAVLEYELSILLSHSSAEMLSGLLPSAIYCPHTAPPNLFEAATTPLVKRLRELQHSMQRLEFCVTQLSTVQSIIIRSLYFDEMSQKELSCELHTSERSVRRYRQNAVAALTELYATLIQV